MDNCSNFSPSAALIAKANAQKNIPLQYDEETGTYFRDVSDLNALIAKAESRKDIPRKYDPVKDVYYKDIK